MDQRVTSLQVQVCKGLSDIMKFITFVLPWSKEMDWIMCVQWVRKRNPTFIEANLVPQNDHPFGEELVLEVLGKEGAQLRLQQLPGK